MTFPGFPVTLKILGVSGLYQSSPTTAVLAQIPDGLPGVAATLRAMSQFTKDGKKNMFVRQTALRQIAGCAQKDYACYVEKLHAFVRDSIQYVQDVSEVETLATPQKTLEFAAGDCDDKATLLAAMLESIGFKTRFVAIGFEPGIYSHVYAEVLLGTRWIALETTEPVDAGWSPDPLLIRAGPYRWHN